MSFYTVLNVETDSSLSQIKAAYKHLARVHHPDKSSNGQDDRFKQIALAYATLSDNDKRREYDERIGLTRFFNLNFCTYCTQLLPVLTSGSDL